MIVFVILRENMHPLREVYRIENQTMHQRIFISVVHLNYTAEDQSLLAVNP